MRVSVSMVISSSGFVTSYYGRRENALAIHPWKFCSDRGSFCKQIPDKVALWSNWYDRFRKGNLPQEKISNFLFTSFTTQLFPPDHCSILHGSETNFFISITESIGVNNFFGDVKLLWKLYWTISARDIMKLLLWNR